MTLKTHHTALQMTTMLIVCIHIFEGHSDCGSCSQMVISKFFILKISVAKSSLTLACINWRAGYMCTATFTLNANFLIKCHLKQYSTQYLYPCYSCIYATHLLRNAHEICENQRLVILSQKCWICDILKIYICTCTVYQNTMLVRWISQLYLQEIGHVCQ